MIEPLRYSQYDSALSRGNAMSGRAHLERQDVVGQAAEGEGPGEEIQHQAAVHGEQRVVLLEARGTSCRGCASCVRNANAMSPARKNMTSDVTM